MSGPAVPAPHAGVGPGPEVPDMSHLSEEERSIILSVMERQKKEEEKEQSMLKKLHQQFEMYKDQVKKLGAEPETAHMARVESPTCGICRKTKFADGCGRACCYCQSRFCARCGGRVPLRANKGLPPPLSNGATERRRSPSGSYYDGGGRRMPRSPSDLGLQHRSRSPHGCRGYGEEELRGRRPPIRDGRGCWHSQDPLDQVQDEIEHRQRQEEEFQARYRSDPNLARYPVKLQPSEEAMRMLAQVSRVRHQRRHSDVSLATAEDHLTPRHAHRQSRASGLVGPGGQRSFSVDRTANHISPSSPHLSPVPQQHLDPSSALRKKSTNESAVQRGQRMGRMHVIGSFSSSEEDLVTTPDYTSCDEPDRLEVSEQLRVSATVNLKTPRGEQEPGELLTDPQT
ncbi:hypothetical protein PAMP_008588 [Pampus punctatissimus]